MGGRRRNLALPCMYGVALAIAIVCYYYRYGWSAAFAVEPIRRFQPRSVVGLYYYHETIFPSRLLRRFFVRLIVHAYTYIYVYV